MTLPRRRSPSGPRRWACPCAGFEGGQFFQVIADQGGEPGERLPRRVWLQLCHSPSKALWAARRPGPRPPPLPGERRGRVESSVRDSVADDVEDPAVRRGDVVAADHHLERGDRAGWRSPRAAGRRWAVIGTPRAGGLRFVLGLDRRRRARRPTSVRIIRAGTRPNRARSILYWPSATGRVGQTIGRVAGEVVSGGVRRHTGARRCAGWPCIQGLRNASS